MRLLITGSNGKVGRHVVRAAVAAGHFVVGVDLSRGVHDTPAAGDAQEYFRCDLAADAASILSLVLRFKPDAVIHIAAIPDPTHDPAHVVMQNNLMSTFNVIEACVLCNVPRLVNVSSETVPGFFFPHRVTPGADASSHVGLPRYLPVDELHPAVPQDPYALSKVFGEQLCDAALRRCAPGALSIVSIRPSWCQDASNIERNLGPLVRDATVEQAGQGAYIIITDLAAAMLLAATRPGLPSAHEVVYIAAADIAGGHDLAEKVTRSYGAGVVPLRPLARADASSISCAKATALLGWTPKMSWRDYLDGQGSLLQGAPRS